MRYEICLMQRDWQLALGVLAGDSMQLLVGPMGIHTTSSCPRLLSRRLEAVGPHSLSNWLAHWQELVVVRSVDEWSAEMLQQWGDSLSPTRFHRVALIGLGLGSAAGRLTARLWDHGTWGEVSVVSVVGPGLPRWILSRREDFSPSTESEKNGIPKRWSRTAGALTRPTWRRLQAATAVVVGCGRTGSLAAEMLARMGIGHLVLIDRPTNRLAISDLDSTWSVTAANAGHQKVDALREGLRRSFPELDVHAVYEPAQSSVGIAAMRDADLIVTTVDADVARLIAAEVAAAYLRPHLDIGTGVFIESGVRRMGGDVRLLLPGDCVLCQGGLRDLADARYELASPPSILRRGPARSWSERRAGSLATVNAVAVGTAAQMYCDLLAGRIRASRWAQLSWDLEGTLHVEHSTSTNAVECANCRQAGLGDFRFS